MEKARAKAREKLLAKLKDKPCTYLVKDRYTSSYMRVSLDDPTIGQCYAYNAHGGCTFNIKDVAWFEDDAIWLK